MMRDPSANPSTPKEGNGGGASASEYNLGQMDNRSFHFANPIYDLESSLPEHSGAAQLETDRKTVPDQVQQPGSAVIGMQIFFLL